MRTHYEKLGVTRKSTPEEIRREFHMLSRKAHPDRGGDSRRYAELTCAYEELMDPAKKARYDRAITLEFGVCSRCGGVGVSYKSVTFHSKMEVVCETCKGSGCGFAT